MESGKRKKKKVFVFVQRAREEALVSSGQNQRKPAGGHTWKGIQEWQQSKPKRQKNEESLNQKKVISKSYLRESKLKRKTEEEEKNKGERNGWGERTGTKAVTVKETRRKDQSDVLFQSWAERRKRETSLSFSLCSDSTDQAGPCFSAPRGREEEKTEEEDLLSALYPWTNHTPPHLHGSICLRQVGSPVPALMLPPTSTL